ncbi:MAG TPA: hypothetical protein VMB50_16880 [Myxococcales bacterium]|nr:hypothetical protein [Myxococcales bacterium]
MRRTAALVVGMMLAACTNSPAPPSLPGTLLGAFQFTATLVPENGSGLQTTCQFDPDAGFTAPPSTLTFYAYVSEAPGAGGIYWEILGGPYEDGGLTKGTLTVNVTSCAPITGCGCVASVTEQIVLAQVLDGGALAPQLAAPILQLTGWIDDTLSSEASACLDAGLGQLACLADAGPGCGLGADGTCDIVYTVVGVPGLPGS